VALVEDYLTMRRSLGFAIHVEGQELIRFARFAEQAGHRGPLTTNLAVRWARLPSAASPIYWARRLDVVRRFAKYRLLFDRSTEVPPPGLLGPSYRRPTPHIYSSLEIAALLEAASKLGPVRGLRPWTYETLFGLLASTGLRISEALRLRRTDVDLEHGVITGVETKFHKSRLVPLHPSTMRALRRYAARRDRYHRQRAHVPAFFVTERGTELKYWRTMMTFHSLRTHLGWVVDGRKPPRIHDLRHSFAVARLLRWYDEGDNVDQRIADLATYLGHVKVSDTYWYLTAIPALLAASARRFEGYARRAGRGCP